MKNFYRSNLAVMAISGMLLLQTTSCQNSSNQEKVDIKDSVTTASHTDTTKWAFPCDEASIRKYTAFRVSKAPVIDGKLDEEFWSKIPRSPRFVDLITGAKTRYNTEAAIAWDDENLYIAFWVEEPDIEAKLKKHNDLIYTENDVEVFIAGKNAYYEYEMNALNTRYEAFFMWKDDYLKNGFDKNPAFKLSNPLVKDFNGVGLKNHPRGLRYGSWDFKFPGMQSGVAIDGTLNNPKDRDRMWTVELAFPWKGMEWLMKGDDRAIPPLENDIWRIDFTRFNTKKAEGTTTKDSGGWAWSPHGIWDSHVPECFPKVTFSKKEL